MSQTDDLELQGILETTNQSALLEQFSSKHVELRCGKLYYTECR